ncbi:MAG: glycoside hydrolase family 3 N-terminal domain-containing protein, partial [Elusimicrobiota bacterium]
MTDLSSQLIFPGFRIGRDDPREAEGLVEMGVGGFCVYYGKAAQVAALTRRLQRKARIPLLFCADYEDGTASHVEGGTAFPSNMALGASGREDLAFLKGELTAGEARVLGVRWVFAPVLDLGGRADNPIISVRSFGADPGLVSRMGAAAMRGLREGGALSCAKHFPGHGQTRLDSHLALPRLEASRAALLGRELVPFAATARLADSVMLAHLHVPAVGDEPGLPSSLSRR